MLVLAQRATTHDPSGAVAAAMAAMAGGFVIFGLIMLAIMIAIYYVIIKKTGYNPLLALLMLVPGIGPLILLIMLAFTEWPIQRELNALRAQLAGGAQYPGAGGYSGSAPGPGAAPYLGGPTLPPPPGPITPA
jgi:hypothetical protein